MLDPAENILNYKFGIFYFNYDDKRLMVPKMNKTGFTLNMAHKTTYITLVLMVLIVIGYSLFF